MRVDDHYGSWGLDAKEVDGMMDQALGLFISGLAIPPRVARKRRSS